MTEFVAKQMSFRRVIGAYRSLANEPQPSGIPSYGEVRLDTALTYYTFSGIWSALMSAA
jgi:hypothetical protein